MPHDTHMTRWTSQEAPVWQVPHTQELLHGEHDTSPRTATQHCREAYGNEQPRVGEDPRPGLLPLPCSAAASWGHRPSPGPLGVQVRKQPCPGVPHWQSLRASCKQTAVAAVPKAPRPRYLCQHSCF